ncbi:AfsR/SARP family transcriptional regulator [Streptomyces sp. CC224B]|uniref:AfsR/SARP family transcriptional regulator n=1 Tax=Streptomyces sp. CC224B TaxID=3044571 RepID=UPI0024A8A00B|nr:AfsR/SARP family transcriptional regulator [Streptomyces sp. CC224B]
MQFRILGPVEMYDERTGVRILPAGAKQRALLGALVALAGHHVSVPRLIDELWGEHPPANAANALQAHVARLRRQLPARAPHPGPDAGAGGAGQEWITTCPPGYVLRLGGADTDARAFAELAARAQQAAPHTPGRAADLLRQALALWRGPALEGSVLGDICAAEAAQLEEHRLAALELLYDACLRAGRHGEITGELEELTTEHPMRERFYDQLMLALYRCGRQAEALCVYDRARKRLVHELGVEPGPVLRARMEAILRHDTALSPPAPRPAAPPATVLPAAALPTAVPLAGAGVQAGAGAGEVVLALGTEIDRLHRRIEALRLQQRQLLRRFEALTAGAGAPLSAP